MATEIRVHTKKAHKGAIKPTVQAALNAGDIQGVIDNLTTRQRLFVEEYLVDFDGKAAVLRAGYNVSNKNAPGLAAEMLAHPGIRAAIDQLTLDRAKETTLKPDYVMNKLRQTIEKAERDNNHSAVLRGCEIMARALGMFVERKEISGPNGDAIRLQQVQQAADAFTSAISGLIERGREDGSFVIIGPEC